VPLLASFQLVCERLDPPRSVAEFFTTQHRASGPEGSLLTLVSRVSERTPEEVGLPLVDHDAIIWLSRRRANNSRTGSPRIAKIVTFNAIEKLYAKPVEPIGAD